ncbi:MAG TPA: aspartate aminotransferase family protein [Pyrinomonadaceae bacterium]|nr:aspartate aminotransferase family protein [Chloracidobacterium sp.]MBP9934762.1 aspartate aminotransferase family protein [Pyrinomonadaceae bacterium]MBK7803207.1 aspartate aminotransferase family protein [Chloracidobacterium sp.]MBK9438148.1 aspartate aminotransferase family protein [Chloracidobacterium sp.]MBL0240978.1 aspartate aminotransferase family protein [Chloracidobacterium sp.]
MTQPEQKSSLKSTIEKHKEFLFPAVATYYQEPIALVKGEGEYVWDDQGNRYLDCFGGVLTVSVGHANPRINEAVLEQNKTIQHTSALYANPNQSNLAEKLAEITPGDLKKSFFTSTGTEADDTAQMAAKIATGRHEVVVLRHSYSGRSATALSSTGHSNWRPLPAQVAGIVHAPAPYCYRCPFKLEYPSCGVACAQDIEELIQTTTTGEIAAFMAEPILGVGGFIVPPPEYFEIAYGIARNYGGLCIADEVQTAWGRTGDKWFGIEHWNVEPDIITSAKGMANGIPIGWTIATPEVADKFPGLTFATFGGNPVSTAAALAVIKMIEDDDLRTNCRVVGDYFRSKLDELKDKYPVIGDVRGMGLMQGIELVKDRQTKEPAPAAVLTVFEETKRQGVLIGKGGLYGNVIRTGMMLNSTKDNVDELIRALDAGFALC